MIPFSVYDKKNFKLNKVSGSKLPKEQEFQFIKAVEESFRIL